MNTKLVQLIKLLRQQTEAGKVNWTWVVDDVVRTSLANSLIRLSRDMKRVHNEFDELTDLPVVNIVVTGPDGRVVEDEEVAEGEVAYGDVESLFKAAHRVAANGDRVLDEIINSLPKLVRP